MGQAKSPPRRTPRDVPENAPATTANQTRSQASDDRLREAQREVARAGNLQVSLAGDDSEAEQRFLRFRALDPFPEIPSALLNSADILDYVAATGMLHPFNPARLKSASYEVSLLGNYVIHDETTGRRRRGVLEEGETFTLPKNSIAFMSVEPYFRVPDYIALRHNLKIGHVYKGLLVGTGPLIDPGFVGNIALPLHNLTENDYEFEGGKGIIWVEFTKLSPRLEWSGGSAPRGGSYITFPAERSRDKGVEAYIAEAVDLLPLPASSSALMATRASEAVKIARRANRTARTISYIGVATLLALALAVIQQLVALNYEIANLKVEIEQISTPTGSLIPTPTSIPSPSVTP